MVEYRTTYHDGDFVITKTDPINAGYPEIIKTLENRMRRLLKIANLNTGLTPHSLRTPIHHSSQKPVLVFKK